jgi:hypothetical protein
MEGKVFGGRKLEIYFGNPINLIPHLSGALVGGCSSLSQVKRGKFHLKSIKKKCHLFAGRLSLMINHSIIRRTFRSFAGGQEELIVCFQC